MKRSNRRSLKNYNKSDSHKGGGGGEEEEEYSSSKKKIQLYDSKHNIKRKKSKRNRNKKKSLSSDETLTTDSSSSHKSKKHYRPKNKSTTTTNLTSPGRKVKQSNSRSSIVYKKEGYLYENDFCFGCNRHIDDSIVLSTDRVLTGINFGTNEHIKKRVIICNICSESYYRKQNSVEPLQRVFVMTSQALKVLREYNNRTQK
jgi:hypothetical protein